MNVTRFVKFGDGKTLKVKGVGGVNLQSYLNKIEFINITLHNLLFVPDIRINLFSVGRALDKGYIMPTNKIGG